MTIPKFFFQIFLIIISESCFWMNKQKKSFFDIQEQTSELKYI
jgi:hypothetical protein